MLTYGIWVGNGELIVRIEEKQLREILREFVKEEGSFDKALDRLKQEAELKFRRA